MKILIESDKFIEYIKCRCGLEIVKEKDFKIAKNIIESTFGSDPIVYDAETKELKSWRGEKIK